MGDFAGMMVGLAFWATVAAIVLLPTYLKYRERRTMQETLRRAIELGQPVPTELIETLQRSAAARPAWTPESDLRRGVVLVCTGLGLAGLGYGLWYGLMSVNDIAANVSGGVVAGVGAIPGLIGAGHILLWATRRDRARQV